MIVGYRADQYKEIEGTAIAPSRCHPGGKPRNWQPGVKLGCILRTFHGPLPFFRPPGMPAFRHPGNQKPRDLVRPTIFRGGDATHYSANGNCAKRDGWNPREDIRPARPVPFETVFCRVSPTEKAALKSMAEYRGMTINDFVSHMLDIFIRARTINERERMRAARMLQRFDKV
jgi:hypothetical protein